MLETIRLPLVPRNINAVGRRLQNRGVPSLPLSPKTLEHRARTRTGLSDFGENEFEEPPQALRLSAERHADLSIIGRLARRNHLSNVLLSRRHPPLSGRQVAV